RLRSCPTAIVPIELPGAMRPDELTSPATFQLPPMTDVPSIVTVPPTEPGVPAALPNTDELPARSRLPPIDAVPAPDLSKERLALDAATSPPMATDPSKSALTP